MFIFLIWVELFIRFRLGEFGLDKFDKSIVGLGGLDTELLAHLFLHKEGDELSHLSHLRPRFPVLEKTN